ncbi:MAG TPA: amino acid ABC transporter permease [Acidimicrobiales bacterium]|nr:amino acid ABC transporter permease [Acidimicrobiales bacterium]
MALTKRQRARLVRFGVYGLTIAFLAFIAVKADWPALRKAFFDPEVFADQFPDIVIRAARNTLIITALAFAIALALGLVLALMRLSSIRPYRWFAGIWIELFRGIPALITIIAVGFAVPIALDFRVPGRYGAGSVAIGIVYSAYLAETIRAGIEAVPRGQAEAARSLGMSQGRATVSIVIPQAFRIIIPPLTNEFIALIKDTSLLFVLGTTADTIEITKFARDNVNKTFNITPLVAAALVYLAITIPMTRLVAVMERRAAKAR